MDKRSMLNDIVKHCEVRFNRGVPDTWKHGDFNDLNREIFNDTGVNISANTLKRIFGKISVDDDYLPQYATLDALKKYGRYSFPETTKPSVAEESKAEQNVLKASRSSKITIAIIIVGICAISLFVIFKSKKRAVGSIKQTSIEGVLPATVFFDLQLPNNDDSVFVNFGDKSPLTYIKPNQKKIAHNYLFPGVFNVSLQTKQNTIVNTTSYVRSDKWIGLGYHRQRDFPDHYYAFPAEKKDADSLFYIPSSQLYKTGIDTTGSYFTRLCNFTPSGYALDNFTFETTFKNDLHDNGMYCHSTQFQVSGINGIIRFKLVNAGCSSKVMNVVSEETFWGNNTDLSKFVVDLKDWNSVKLINEKKQLSLWVNGKLIFKGAYKKPLGEIKGLFIEFEGNGFVKNCELKSNAGKTLYQF